MSAQTDTQQRHPAIGRIFGNYEVKSVLGDGGMGEVFLAEHQRLGRRVALKRLRDRFAKNRKAVKRFVDEAWAIGQIQHRNIVKVTDFVLGENDVYYIMELLEGQTLAAALKKRGALPPAYAMHIAREVAAALSAVHTKGFVHGDIKPSNIFLVPTPAGGDTVKLLDFGIASLMHDDTESDESSAAQLVTPVYMSPEQANRQSTTGAADLYSLGSVLYHMLAGTPPFEAATFAEYVYKHTQEPAPPLRRSAPRDQRLSRELEAVVMRCLEKKPTDRFPNAQKLLDALVTTPLQRTRGDDLRDLMLGRDRTGVVTRFCVLSGVIALLVALWAWPAGEGHPPRIWSPARGASAPSPKVAPDARAPSPKRPVPVVLSVQSDPPRAWVRRLSPRPRILGLTPLTLKRARRDERWQLEVQLERYVPQRLEISLNASVHRRVVLKLETPAPPMTGPLPMGGMLRQPPPPRVPPRPVDPRGIIDPFSEMDGAVRRRRY